MGKALYRKYRSKSLDEIVGQEHITTTLKNALKKGTISHAYLLTGPRGVGKTSVARILAHEVNELVYDEETTHMDIIEIDAASNRRIEEIRDLRDKVHITPTSAKYKVYIIDEVHMLTKEAFNALLKTLEEPPEHVIFILATTEAHKLPETIISRTQRFTFKPIEGNDAVKQLRDISKKENIKISDEALALIAEHGGGSFRDSISLLDQASNLDKTVEVEDIERLLGIAPKQAVQQLHAALISGTPAQLVDALQLLRERGFQAASVAKQLSEILRMDLLAGESSLEPQAAANLLGQLLEVPSAHDPDSFLELTLLTPVLNRLPAASTTKKIKKETPELEEIRKEDVPKKEIVKEEVRVATKTTAKPPSSSILEAWPEILNTLKHQHNTLYSIVRMAEPVEDGKILTLKFGFAFHQKRLNEAKNQQILLDIIAEQTGLNVKLECEVDKEAKPPTLEPISTESNTGAPLDTISNIFGNAELLD